MLAYAYTRCSHRESALSGAGLAAQDRNCQRMFEEARFLYPHVQWAAESYDHDEPGHFCDRAVSAFKCTLFRRRAGIAMIDRLKRGDIVFCSAVDRMFRSIFDLATTLKWFEEKGVILRFGNISVDTSTPMGRMVLHQLVMFAEWESTIKSMRQKEAFAIRKAAKAAGEQVPAALRQPCEAEKPRDFLRGTKRPQFNQAMLATIPRKTKHDPDIMKVNGPGTVYIYTRCSHLDSVESGLGLESQRVTCMHKVGQMLHDNPQLEFGGEFSDEAVSAWKHRFVKRPAGGRLVSQFKPGDHVVFARIDRAFRSVRDMAETIPTWQENGVTVWFAADGIESHTPIGRAAMAMLAVFAQLEPELTGSRTREALRELRAQGRGLSRIWGFAWQRAGGHRELVPCRRTIAKIRLAHWLITRMGVASDKAAVRIEELAAKREHRRPLPMAGIDPRLAEKWFGPGVDGYALMKQKVFSSRKTGKPILVCLKPEFTPPMCRHAVVRWPTMAAYCEEQRRESRKRREAQAAKSA